MNVRLLAASFLFILLSAQSAFAFTTPIISNARDSFEGGVTQTQLFEDFEDLVVMDGAAISCGENTLTSTTENNCANPGAVSPDVTFSAVGVGDLFAVGDSQIVVLGSTSKALSIQIGTDDLRIDFNANHPNAVGFDIFSTVSNDMCDIEVFDIGGSSIYTGQNACTNSEISFFGIAHNEGIGRITLGSQGAGSVVIDNMITGPWNTDIEVSSSISSSSVAPGENLTLSLTFTNNGPDIAAGVMATLPIPDGVTLVSENCGLGEPVDNVLSGPTGFGGLVVGEPLNCDIVFKVNDDATGGLVNEITVVTDTPGDDPLNNSTKALSAIGGILVDFDKKFRAKRGKLTFNTGLRDGANQSELTLDTLFPGVECFYDIYSAQGVNDASPLTFELLASVPTTTGDERLRIRSMPGLRGNKNKGSKQANIRLSLRCDGLEEVESNVEVCKPSAKATRKRPYKRWKKQLDKKLAAFENI